MLNRNLIKNYIDSQPQKVVSKFDINNNIIKYEGIYQHQNINIISGDEEVVRAYILSKLVNELGYPADRIEIEKQYTAGRPSTITSRIDIIVRDSAGDAFLFIELKSPEDFVKDKDDVIREQLFNLSGMEKNSGTKVKYLVLYTINTTDGEIEDEIIVIDNEKTTTYSEWESKREYLDTLPVKYGKAQKTPYIKGSNKDLKTTFTHEQLYALQKDLHNVLWGGGGTDDNEVFSALVNLILAKIQDEDEKDDGDRYDFQALVFENEEDEQFENNDILFERINRLYRDALRDKLYITNEDEINNARVIDTKKFSLSKLKYTVQQLEGLSFVDGKNSLNGKDILGDFFEGIIRDGFKQSKGQFFTPVNIVKFMLWGIQADKLALERIKNDQVIPYMIDPSAGSATFLIEYMKFITENMKYRNRNERTGFNNDLGTSRRIEDKVHSEWFYPDNRENKWAKEFIYGAEINFNLGTSSKVNMILHGDGSTNIFVKDGLSPFESYEKESAPNALQNNIVSDVYRVESKNLKVNENFDLILTNPPFSVDLDNDTKRNIKQSFMFGDKKNSENLFIERYYQLLRENGRVAAVLPESVFDTAENKYIRMFIYKYFKVKAIVSLPELTFKPYTTTKTSILFAQKKTDSEVMEWNEQWRISSNKYNRLKTRIENLIKVYIEGKDINQFTSIKNTSETEQLGMLIDMLGEDDLVSNEISVSENIENNIDLLMRFCKIDNGTTEAFGYVNTWWVFRDVSAHFNYDIFMAEADEVGYQRTMSTTRKRPNELYRENEDGRILVDDNSHETILDYLRDIDWD